MILIQHAKIIGLFIGLGMDNVLINVCPKNKGQEVIAELRNALISSWSNYPECTDKGKIQILEIWIKLSKEYGYSFIHQPDGDSLYV